MKKTLTLFAAVLMTAVISAQAPDRMSYQAVIRDASGNLITEQEIGMKISIIHDSVLGASVYIETQSPVTNENGLVTIAIGDGVAVQGNFSGIDWADGPYFIKTETDPSGGTTYTITGTSQMLSVPYALHARTTDQPGPQGETGPPGADGQDGADGADGQDGTNGADGQDGADGADGSDGLSAYEVWLELDNEGTEEEFIASLTGQEGPAGPAGSAGPAGPAGPPGADGQDGADGADGQDGANTLAELSDVDTSFADTDKILKYDAMHDMWFIADDLGITSETDPVFEASGAAGIKAGYIDQWHMAHSWGDHAEEGYLTEETDPSVPAGTTPGEMQYWNGSAWVTVAPGTTGQVLTFTGGVPTWATTVSVGDVENPTTGKIWMDRNLGASQAANSSTDGYAYGDLFQWGRSADGHQIRSSETTSTLSNTPGHGYFILNPNSPYDWRSTQNDNLWQGESGVNNPCPSGYRLPTEAEWTAERQSWSPNDNSAGAFASPLKLPVAGGRNNSNGLQEFVGSWGVYWSSTVGGTNSRNLYFSSSSAGMSSFGRASGRSVRCLKD